MLHRLRCLAFGLMLLAALPGLVLAQSAKQVVEEAFTRYARRMEGIENYTVVQETLGFQTTTYFERQTVDGRSVFVPRQIGGTETAKRTPQSYTAMLEAFSEEATHEGMGQVNGKRCHILVLADLQGGSFGAYAPPKAQGSWKPETIHLFLDQRELLPRKMVMEGRLTQGGESQPVEMTALFRDYREVEGVIHPFRIEIQTEGISSGMSPEEQAKVRESMEGLQEKKAAMSPEQRQMVEQMMGGKLRQMRQMLASNATDFTIRVKELRVNEGPPEGAEPSRLK